MKTILLFTLIFLTFSAKSQSLKEALYGGKLKADTGTVLRKGDSLKIKENTAQKIIADSVEKETIAVKKEAIATEKQNAIAAGKDTTATIHTTTADKDIPGSINTDKAAQILPSEKGETLAAEKNISKDNNKIWKSFIDELTTAIKSETLTSSKLKKGNYFVLIEYKINPDGQISVTSVSVDPSNSFLEQNIKDRLTLNGPQLNPVIDANGRARTVNKKQTLNFVK